MSRANELAEKERRVREFLEQQSLDALLISRQDNFAWLSCGGDNHVGIATDLGSASLLITQDEKWLVCDNIESRRVMEEELEELGFKSSPFNWWEDGIANALEKLTRGGALGADLPLVGDKFVGKELARLRYSLLPDEVERYRWVGKHVAQCMENACQAVKPGMTEHEIAGLLAKDMFSLGIVPAVLLIAADDRAFQHRHPIPTDKKLEKHVMLVTCGRRWGLIVSLTRLVNFGKLPEELQNKHEAVVRLDATFIAQTKPGARVGDIFDAGVETYHKAGYGEEWKLHHQGGPTGYAGRDYRANSRTDDHVQENQAFAWNPSIAGTKSEDTIIAQADRTEIISPTPNLPSVTVELDGQTIQRPDILERY